MKFNVNTTIPFQQEGGRGFKTIPFDLFTDLKTLVHFSLYLPVWWFLDVILAVMSLLDFWLRKKISAKNNNKGKV